MNSTPDSDFVDKWLGIALRLPEITEAWLYGSFAQGSTFAGDVDILVRYQNGWSYEAAQYRRQIESKFGSDFSVPLHAIFLSEDEFRDEADLVGALLANGRCLITAETNTTRSTVTLNPSLKRSTNGRVPAR